MEAAKDICDAKSESSVDHHIVTRLFKRFCLSSKNLNDQARSTKPKTGFWGYAPSHKDKSGE